MCGTPTRHGAYAVLSCPCNDGVTSSLAIEAPGVPAIQRRLVVCIIVVGELEVRINPGNLDARLAKRSFHIRTTNSRVRAKYVWCRGRLRTAEDRRARPGSAALMHQWGRRRRPGADRWRCGGVRLFERSSGARGADLQSRWLHEIAKPASCNPAKFSDFQGISKPERFKASPIRLQPAHHIMQCCCWQQTRRVSSALPAQWGKASRLTLHPAGWAQLIATRVIRVAGKWPGSLGRRCISARS